MALLSVENVSFTHPKCNAPAVRNVSFSVQRGEFIALCGATGSGKSSLLRLLKRELTPMGEFSGTIRFRGTELSALSERDAAARIGFVMQRPEQQIVTDKVWHELAPSPSAALVAAPTTTKVLFTSSSRYPTLTLLPRSPYSFATTTK